MFRLLYFHRLETNRPAKNGGCIDINEEWKPREKKSQVQYIIDKNLENIVELQNKIVFSKVGVFKTLYIIFTTFA